MANEATKGRQGADDESTAADGARRVEERIRSLEGWRAQALADVRRLIHEADPEIEESCKWMKPSNPLGVPVWSHAGIVCTGEAYREKIKLTFARGAALADPHGLFNAGHGGKTRRAIDLREGETLDAEAFEDLVRAAVAENLEASARSTGEARTGARPRSGR